MSKEVERAEPEDFVAHYELLRLQINMVLPMIKRVAKLFCHFANLENKICICVACEAKKFLKDIGVEE